MVNGAWLDFYCIGPLQRQEDRTGLDVAAGIYNFHKENEAWLRETVPAGEVGLVRRGDEEYEGLQEILSENHLAYELARLDAEELARFPVVVVPAADPLGPSEAATIDRYVEQGGRALLTGGVPEGLRSMRDDLEQNFRSVLRASLARLDLVTREEFEVQEAVLAKTRAKLEALEAKVKELEL